MTVDVFLTDPQGSFGCRFGLGGARGVLGESWEALWGPRMAGGDSGGHDSLGSLGGPWGVAGVLEGPLGAFKNIEKQLFVKYFQQLERSGGAPWRLCRDP